MQKTNNQNLFVLLVKEMGRWKTLGVFGIIRTNSLSFYSITKLFISNTLNKLNDGSSLMVEPMVVVREAGVRFSPIVYFRRW